MIDGYSPVKGSFRSTLSLLFLPPSPLLQLLAALSAYDEDEDESDEDYTYVTFADSKLEVDTLDEMSIAIH
jgi:hypothetical protein